MGGSRTGRSDAAVLAAGAGRAWMGTAFGIGLRARSFPLVEQWHGREAELSAQLHKVAPAFRSGFPKGDPAYTPLMFGEGAGSVNCQQPAAAIIQQIVRDADSRLSPM